MGKKMKFNFVRSLWQSSNKFTNEIEIENKQSEFIVYGDQNDLSLIKSKELLYCILRKFLGTYENDFDYNSLTEKINIREKEINELKFIRSLLGKKMIIKGDKKC